METDKQPSAHIGFLKEICVASVDVIITGAAFFKIKMCLLYCQVTDVSYM